MILRAWCIGVTTLVTAAGLLLHGMRRRRKRTTIQLFNGKIIKSYLMNLNQEECDQEFENLLPLLISGDHAGDHSPLVLGLDCEWPSEEPGVSVLQISSQSMCLLFRPSLLRPRRLPPSLFRLLEDPSIIKAGVGIEQDVRRLCDGFGVVPRGVLEVRALVQHLGGVSEGESQSLAALALRFLGMAIDKTQQCSRWGEEQLTPAQIRYASIDAWASQALVWAILDATDLSSQGSRSLLHDLADKSKINLAHRKRKGKAHPRLNLNLQAQGSKAQSPSIRKTDLYENCRLLAPDGQLLCTCSSRKAQWYLQKGIAVLVEEEPLTVQLSFEPAGRFASADGFYTSDKENKCAICGSLQDHVRHHVVPHCYRAFFPLEFKSHISHDILLVCVSCKARANQCDHLFMRKIGSEMNAPLSGARFENDLTLAAVRSAALALLRPSRSQIPEERKKELISVLLASSLFPSADGTTELTEEMLKEASQIEFRKVNEGWQSHAKVVVERLKGGIEGGIEEFVKRWRRHFLKTMSPLHLPPCWSIESRTFSSLN